MNKNYEISWRNPQQTILQAITLTTITWKDVLNAALEAQDMVSAQPHGVVIFFNSHQNLIDNVSIGATRDLFFNRLPILPENLKGIVILVPPSQKGMLKMGIETISNMYHGRNFMQVVDGYETAIRLLEEKLRS